MLVAIVATSVAQNHIDELVENFSSVGKSTFTSAVERDTDTRRIKKVVKKLTLEGNKSHELRRAFEAEKHSGSFTEKLEDGVHTIILTTQNDKTNRIYMLRIENEKTYPRSETTIIVRLK